MTLIPTLKQRLASPSDVIDLAGVDGLSSIDQNGDVVTVGALTRHADVARSGAIAALADLASRIGDAHVRNRGTIGGSIANSDPAADYPAAVVALDATVHTNTRSIGGGDFFTGLFETALQEGEIVKSVDFRIPDAAAYEKFPNPASRYGRCRRHGGALRRRGLRWRHRRRAVRFPGDRTGRCVNGQLHARRR